MTGDAIRGVEFPQAWRGYDPAEVDCLLRDMARLLDAGISLPAGTPQLGDARVLRGYDPQAVDRFFATLASDRAQQAPAPGPVISWEELGYGELEPPEGSGAGDRWAEWRRVADLPGTRLRRASGWTSKIIDTDGQVLMVPRGNTLRVAASGQVFRNDFNRAEIVDATTEVLVLRWTGSHSYRHAGTVVLGPGQRWLRFSIQGSWRRDAVMKAVDESGTEVLWFRKTKRAVVEAVVSPDCGITPEILCLIELAARWLVAYFTPPGGGG